MHNTLCRLNYVDAEEPVDGASSFSGSVADNTTATATSVAQKLLPQAQRRAKASRAGRGGTRRPEDMGSGATDTTNSSSNLLQLSASDAADGPDASPTQLDSSSGSAANAAFQPPANASNAFIVQANAGSSAPSTGDSAANALRSLEDSKSSSARCAFERAL